MTGERRRKQRKRTKVMDEVEEEVEVDEAVAVVEAVEVVEVGTGEAEAEVIMRQTPTKKTKQTKYHRLMMKS
jgi:hypothetical protein